MKKRSKVLTQTFKAILFFELFIIFCILFITIYDIYLNCFGINTIICIVIFLCIGIIILITISPLLIRCFQIQEKSNNSIKYVQHHLSKEFWIEVIPIRNKLQSEYFLQELSKKAKFYAKRMNDDTVEISVKFDKENKKIYYCSFSFEDFTTYFKILNL